MVTQCQAAPGVIQPSHSLDWLAGFIISSSHVCLKLMCAKRRVSAKVAKMLSLTLLH